jgi:hypothetical protein
MYFNKNLITNSVFRVAAVALALTGFMCDTQATPYASGIINNAGTVSFILNENADDVKVLFDNGTSTNDLGALAKGVQSFNLGASTNYQIAVRKATGPGFITANGTNAVVLQTSSDTNPLLHFNNTRGLAVNKNPSSPYFGRIYVANTSAGTTSSNGVVRATGDGIYMLNADQSDALGLGDTASTGGLDMATGGTSMPWRITIGDDDNLYIADWSDADGNLLFTFPNVDSGGSMLKPLSALNTAVVPVGTANTHGSIVAAVVTGSLAAGNLTVYTIDEDLQSNKTITNLTQLNSLWRYDVGSGTSIPYTGDGTLMFTPTGKLGIDFASQVMDLARGADGKFYYTDNRINGFESGLGVLSSSGASLWNSYQTSTNMLGNTAAADILVDSYAVAVSPDQKFVADMRRDGRTWILPLTNGIPDLSRRTWLASFGAITTSREVAFDAADNLYVMNGNAELVRVFSPGGNTTATTGNDLTGTNGTFSLVTVDPSILNQPASISTNAGNTVTFSVTTTGTGTLKYQWLFNGTNISGATTSVLTKSNVQNNSANVGNYAVVITNASNAAITSSVVSLTVIDTLPIITTQPVGKTNAAGTSPNFTVSTIGTDPRTYQWQSNGTNIAGATTTTYTRSNAQTNDSGTFNVVITNPLGVVTSSIVNLLITNTLPVLTTQPKSQTNGAGVNITLTVAISQGTTPVSYQWKFGGNSIASATNTSYVLTDAQTPDSGNYSVTVSNPLGSVTSTNGALTITNAAPIITTQPKSQTNGVGVNITLSVVTTGTDPRTYQWFSNTVSLLNATNTSYVVVNPQTGNTGDSYTVSVVNSLGSANSAAALLTITNKVPTIISQPASVVANVGDNPSFTVGAQGQNPLTYQWFKAGVALSDGGNVTGSSSATLSLGNVQVSDGAFYTVTVTDSTGSTGSAAAQLAVLVSSTPGTGTGLRGDYYTTQALTFTNGPTLTRIDTNVDFNFGAGSPDPAISVDHFTARWTGKLQPLYSQNYTFSTRSDDGSRLWVNGQLLVDRWVNQSVTETAGPPLALIAGQQYDVVMEYFENTSTAEAHLIWSSPSQIKQAIPMTQLYPAATGSAITPVLATSFNGTNIIFNWSGSYTLQTSVTADGPYTNVTALGVGPNTNTLTSDPQRFFRLKAN